VTRIENLVTLKGVVTRPFAKRSVATDGNELATVFAFPVPHSDIGLVRGLRAGQLEALRVLCERYGADLLQVGMRVLGPDTDLKAVVGRAVGLALARLEQLENPRELRHWLIANLISVIRQRLKARRRWRILALFFRTTVSTRDTRTFVGYSEQLLSTYRRLDRLKDSERIVLALSVFNEMEPFELATVLGTSVTKVHRLLERAEVNFERTCDN
jgi:RNA polymerase sigma-70 factor (ECF subfamily)